MFNLIMFNVDWSLGRANVSLGRMFEYTDDHLIDQFRHDGKSLLEKLRALPCLFLREGTTDQTAYVGRIIQARITGREVSLEYTFDAEVPSLQNSFIYANRVELDMSNEFEFSRNHWAVKGVDLYRFLLRAVRPRRQRPTVCQIPQHENIDSALASAMMPFDVRFNAVYDSIRRASDAVGLRCRR